jgi:hypothetical protein
VKVILNSLSLSLSLPSSLSFDIGSCYVAQADPELTIFPSQPPPKSWDYRREPPCLALYTQFFNGVTAKQWVQLTRGRFERAVIHVR